MIQDGGEIGRLKAVRDNHLGRPTLGSGIINVDGRWVGTVRIENVNGV